MFRLFIKGLPNLFLLFFRQININDFKSKSDDEVKALFASETCSSFFGFRKMDLHLMVDSEPQVKCQNDFLRGVLIERRNLKGSRAFSTVPTPHSSLNFKIRDLRSKD